MWPGRSYDSVGPWKGPGAKIIERSIHGSARPPPILIGLSLSFNLMAALHCFEAHCFKNDKRDTYLLIFSVWLLADCWPSKSYM